MWTPNCEPSSWPAARKTRRVRRAAGDRRPTQDELTEMLRIDNANTAWLVGRA
jgi:hypothetical protein